MRTTRRGKHDRCCMGFPHAFTTGEGREKNRKRQLRHAEATVLGLLFSFGENGQPSREECEPGGKQGVPVWGEGDVFSPFAWNLACSLSLSLSAFLSLSLSLFSLLFSYLPFSLAQTCKKCLFWGARALCPREGEKQIDQETKSCLI